MRLESIKKEDVIFVPDQLEQGVLYVSDTYGVAVHSCACGCGNEVVMPLGDGGWHLTKEGDLVSLSPSIGNYQIPCKSHYFIRNNRIDWC